METFGRRRKCTDGRISSARAIARKVSRSGSRIAIASSGMQGIYTREREVSQRNLQFSLLDSARFGPRRFCVSQRDSHPCKEREDGAPLKFNSPKIQQLSWPPVFMRHNRPKRMARSEADGETEPRMIAGHGMPCPYGNDEEFS